MPASDIALLNPDQRRHPGVVLTTVQRRLQALLQPGRSRFPPDARIARL